MTNFAPIHYTRRDVALMVQIVALDGIERLARVTHTAAADLQQIAAGERQPSAGVLAFFDLQPTGRGFLWRIW